MKFYTTKLFLPGALLAACMLVTPSSSAARSRPAYEETHKPRGGFFSGRPAQTTPAAQLSYAKKRQNAGHLRTAARQYSRLVNYWPDSPEAPSAQFEYAQLLDKRNRYHDAFDAYKLLLEQYPNHLPYDRILDRMFNLAESIRDHRKGRFLVFPGFTAPARAAPLFETLVDLGPEWERAPEALYTAGQAYDAERLYEKAALAYSRIQYRYPLSPYAEKASMAKALDLYKLSRETPNDERRLEEARAALAFYINNYPLGPNIQQAREMRDTVHQQRARMAYERALYYDTKTRRPRSALMAYQRFLQTFPQTQWTPHAEQRVSELRVIVSALPQTTETDDHE